MFIEKPYYENLLKTDHTSPFRRKQLAIGIVYMIMVCKKTCVVYVNLNALNSDCTSIADKRVAHLALAATGFHSLIWFGTFLGYDLGGCKKEQVTTGNDSSEESEEGSSSDGEEDP